MTRRLSHFHPRRPAFLAAALLSVLVSFPAGAGDSARAVRQDLRQALTFHASFDRGLDADFALGDPKLYSNDSMKQPRVGTPGLPAAGPVLPAQNAGRFGEALRFHRKSPLLVYFNAERNIDYRPTNWSGTVSFWLRLDPQRDLAPGFTDPVQITPRSWNDAAFFVEFGKDETPRHFRLGAYADLKVWNPQNREWGKIPMREKPLLSIHEPHFRGDKWTHVVFTFADFNTGRPDGVARLYLDGRSMGALAEREQTFTWEPAQTRIMIGLSYVGYFDELSIFNRALTDREIKALHRLPDGARSLE